MDHSFADSREETPMPSRSLVRAFLALYVTLGVIVLAESVRTVMAAVGGHFHPHDRSHAILLGCLESVAAVLFLIPRTMRLGAAGLLLVFVLAFLRHALGGEPPLALLVYGVAVLFVRVHGVQGYRWNCVVA
jgi:hypothetical protein